VLVLVTNLGSADDLGIILFVVIRVVELKVVVNSEVVKLTGQIKRDLGGHLNLELLVGSSVGGNVESSDNFLVSDVFVSCATENNAGVEITALADNFIRVDVVNSLNLSDEVSVSVSGRAEVLGNLDSCELNEFSRVLIGVNSCTMEELVSAEPLLVEVGLGERELSEALGEVVASVRAALNKTVLVIVALSSEELGAILRVTLNKVS